MTPETNDTTPEDAQSGTNAGHDRAASAQSGSHDGAATAQSGTGAGRDQAALAYGGAVAGEPGVGWRRLNNRMLVIHPIQELIRAWPLLIGLIFAGTTGHGAWWSIGVTGLVVVAGMARWFTTRYRITPEQVQVRKGLFRRQLLTVPRDRIRSVDVTANALHRTLGLAKIEIGTGRSDKKDDGIKLDALGKAEATALRGELLHRTPAQRSAGATGQAETLLVAVRPEWVRYGPFTLTGVVTVGVLAGVLSRAFNEAHIDPTDYGPLHRATGWFSRSPLALEIAAGVFALLLVVSVASTFGYILAFFNFRLTRNSAGTLHIARGLITTRATTIEERRLRGVELSEPLLLRSVRGARLIALTTGLRVGRGAERGGSLLLPPAPRAEAIRVGADVLTDPAPLTCALTPHGRQAHRRRFSRALGVTLAINLLLLALWGLGAFPAWAWQSSLVLLPIAAGLAADRAAALGHALSGPFLVARRGSLVRRRSALSRDGVIGWNISRSFFQRRAGLATLVATTAAGKQQVDIPDVPLTEAVAFAEQARPGLLTPFLRPDEPA